MANIYSSAAQLIGGTPLLELGNLVLKLGADIVHQITL